jgi:hypothetical protein
MATDPDSKIFLSHSGKDKPLVRRFAETLCLLGFEPWLDEVQMVAGTSLHRGLHKGFKESCAAVFFVTGAFEDERYLAREVDYALEEATQRPQTFKIITLVFTTEPGRGVVPELLRPYIWKEPADELEALREIIRALPICTGRVDWRDRVVNTSIQEKILQRWLDESRDPLYTDAKEMLANWADTHPGSFQADQVFGSDEFGPYLVAAWNVYDNITSSNIQNARNIYNKFWNRLVEEFDATGMRYFHLFELIGDNLRLMSVTHPLEVLLAGKLGTRGKPNLLRLLELFQAWVVENQERYQHFTKSGVRLQKNAISWTQVWPWRV